MFEFMKVIEVDDAISGLYYAIRLIRHRDNLVDLRTGIRVEGLESEPSRVEQKIAILVVEEIQTTENLSVRELDDSTAEEYVSQLVGIMRELAIAEFGCDKDRGRELLASFEPALAKPTVQVG
jgi:hypothetical protein